MEQGVYVPTISQYFNHTRMRIALRGVCPEGGSRGLPISSMVSQAGDRHVLAGEWKYIDSTGADVPLTLDEQGNGWHGELTHTSPPYG